MDSGVGFQPRRSCLYMPGSNERALEKAKNLAADMLVLDLEDAVTPEAKLSARTLVADAVAARGYGFREVLVRSNGLDTPWGRDDMDMAVRANANGVLVPKVNSAADVLELNAALNDMAAPSSFALWAMIETPLAVLNVQQIAATASSTRLQGFIIGTNDLAKETNAIATPGRMAFQYALSVSLLAARACGLHIIDGVYNDFKNEAGFAAECEQGRVMGFDGKSLIHPAQIAKANQTFAPNEQALAAARELVAAFALPENQGKGVIKVGGAMVELLHLEQAKRTLAIQAAIEQRLQA